MKVRRQSWGHMQALAKKLAQQIKDDNYSPDILIGLTRGGLVPAMYLSDLLGVSEILTIRVKHYATVGETTAEPKIMYNTTYNLDGMNVLIIDDCADTGKSLEVAIEKIKAFNPKEIKVATLQLRKTSIFKPHYSVEDMEDYWVIFPWNIIEDSLKLIEKTIMPTDIVSPTWINKTMHENYGVDVTDIADEIYKSGKERNLF